MENDGVGPALPLLYYRTREDIEAYAQKPTEAKFRWLQSQMEFFFRSMPEEAKQARERISALTGPAVGGTDPETM
jgi:hypothetical protein